MALAATTARPPNVAGAVLDELDELAVFFADEDEGAAEERSRLGAPDLNALLEVAGVRRAVGVAEREVLGNALRKAAEKRVAGVTAHQRRRYYDHAARLVAAAVASDPSPKTSRWVDTLRAEYSRYPALCRELDRHLMDS